MTIQSIYSHYKIMPNLQEHQLRVAGVSFIIGKSMSNQNVDTENIVVACLLHDMGNIIKFKLDLFPEFVNPEGLDYWKKIQQEYIRTYGADEHVATMSIVKGIIPHMRDNPCEKKRIIELIEAIGFSNAKENYETTDFGKKIAAYADMRVKPYGVTSLKDRLGDGRRRFSRIQKHDLVVFEEMTEYLQKIEDQIFAQSTIFPSDITEEAVQNIIPKCQQTLHIRSIDQKDR